MSIAKQCLSEMTHPLYPPPRRGFGLLYDLRFAGEGLYFYKSDYLGND